MHEPRERLPFEYAVLVLLTGWAWVFVAVGVMFLFTWVRQCFEKSDPADAHGRPFMTPALRDAVAKMGRKS